LCNRLQGVYANDTHTFTLNKLTPLSFRQQLTLDRLCVVYARLQMLRDGLEGAPRYSMASRHFLKDSERSPGPAAYLPTMWAMNNRPPEYTFGMKHHSDKSFITPGTVTTGLIGLMPIARKYICTTLIFPRTRCALTR